MSPVSQRYSPPRGRSSTCYSPVRHFTQGLLPFLVRLACVKRAASVDSEPGSNSHLKCLIYQHLALSSSFPNHPGFVLQIQEGAFVPCRSDCISQSSSSALACLAPPFRVLQNKPRPDTDEVISSSRSTRFSKICDTAQAISRRLRQYPASNAVWMPNLRSFGARSDYIRKLVRSSTGRIRSNLTLTTAIRIPRYKSYGLFLARDAILRPQHSAVNPI